MPDATEWIRSVLLVGAGRGFVIEVDGQRLVVTAAHCLPPRPDGQALPPPHSFPEERTYSNLLGPLGSEPTVWAECLFADPVADIAVFGSPDIQELEKEADAYDALMGAAVPLAIGALPFAPERLKLPNGAEIAGPSVAESEAWLLALEGHWFACRVMSRGRSLWIRDAVESIRGGMSGSPILGPDGRAIGVVCNSFGGQGEDFHEGGPEPYLPANLPGWVTMPEGLSAR